MVKLKCDEWGIPDVCDATAYWARELRVDLKTDLQTLRDEVEKLKIADLARFVPAPEALVMHYGNVNQNLEKRVEELQAENSRLAEEKQAIQEQATKEAAGRSVAASSVHLAGHMATLRGIVKAQRNYANLWQKAQVTMEVDLQDALRRLHRAIDREEEP